MTLPVKHLPEGFKFRPVQRMKWAIGFLLVLIVAEWIYCDQRIVRHAVQMRDEANIIYLKGVNEGMQIGKKHK